RTRRLAAFAVPVAVVAIGAGAWSLKAHTAVNGFVFINNANSQNIYYGNNPWTPLYQTWWYGSHKDYEHPTGDEKAFLRTLNRINRQPHEVRDRIFVQLALDHIRDRPDLFAIRTASRVRTFAGFDTFTSSQLV